MTELEEFYDKFRALMSKMASNTVFVQPYIENGEGAANFAVWLNIKGKGPVVFGYTEMWTRKERERFIKAAEILQMDVIAFDFDDSPRAFERLMSVCWPCELTRALPESEPFPDPRPVKLKARPKRKGARAKVRG